MVIYHGTSHYGGDRLQMSAPEVKPRDYFGNMKAFCCTESFRSASLFAFRRSPAGVLRGDYSQAGVVMEYVLCPDNDGQNFFRTRDHRTTQDEDEVLIPDPSKLTLVAIHKLDSAGAWERFALEAA